LAIGLHCVSVAEWIDMPLGIRVGLDQSDIMLDGVPQNYGFCALVRFLCTWQSRNYWIYL